MNFLNIGAGEILVIILLALMMFGPDDIRNIMRTIGKYTRAMRRAWAEVVAALDGEVLPDEIQEVVDETKASLDDVQQTLNEVETSVSEIEEEVKQDVKDIDAPLHVELPDAMAEVKARKATSQPSATSQRAIYDPGVSEIMAMVNKSSGTSKKDNASPPPAAEDRDNDSRPTSSKTEDEEIPHDA